MTKNVKVKGIQRADGSIDTEMISLALWIQSKRIVRERRLAEERARAKRRKRERERGDE